MARCLTIIFMPLFGVIFYWLFGYQSIHPSLSRKRKHAEAYRARKDRAGDCDIR